MRHAIKTNHRWLNREVLWKSKRIEEFCEIGQPLAKEGYSGLLTILYTKWKLLQNTFEIGDMLLSMLHSAKGPRLVDQRNK